MGWRQHQQGSFLYLLHGSSQGGQGMMVLDLCQTSKMCTEMRVEVFDTHFVYPGDYGGIFTLGGYGAMT